MCSFPALRLAFSCVDRERLILRKRRENHSRLPPYLSSHPLGGLGFISGSAQAVAGHSWFTLRPAFRTDRQKNPALLQRGAEVVATVFAQPLALGAATSPPPAQRQGDGSKRPNPGGQRDHPQRRGVVSPTSDHPAFRRNASNTSTAWHTKS